MLIGLNISPYYKTIIGECQWCQRLDRLRTCEDILCCSSWALHLVFFCVSWCFIGHLVFRATTDGNTQKCCWYSKPTRLLLVITKKQEVINTYQLSLSGLLLVFNRNDLSVCQTLYHLSIVARIRVRMLNDLNATGHV